MQPSSSFTPVCSVAELQSDPHLSVSLLSHYHSSDAEDAHWLRFFTADGCQAVHCLASHFTALCPPAPISYPLPSSSASPSSAVLSSIVTEVSDLPLYSALLHLLFVAASLDPSAVCPVLIRRDVPNVPLIISSPSPSSPSVLSSLLLLRLQLLALTVSSYPAGVELSEPHPLILHQTLTLLAVEDAELHLAASASLFLLLSTASLPLALPVLLSHPSLPVVLTTCMSLLTGGHESPFLPLALTLIDNVAAWMGLREGQGEAHVVEGEQVVQLWDGVCELLEEAGEGGGGGASVDVVRSAVKALSSLLSIPSLQSPVTLQQYSAYKRRFDAALQRPDDDLSPLTTRDSTAESAAASLPTAAIPASSLNPFDDDAASNGSPSSLSSLVPFTADDLASILSPASSHALSPAMLASKVEALAGLLDAPLDADEWEQYLEGSQYQLLLVLAFLYTQDSLPTTPSSHPSDLLLSSLLSLSSLSSQTATVASAALSHPSFVAVLLSQVTPSTAVPELLRQLRVLFLVLTSSPPPSSAEEAATSSSAIFDRMFPLLTHPDDVVVVLAVYVLLLSHPPSSPIPSPLLSLHSTYTFQAEVLNLLNRGAVSPSSSATPSAEDRHPLPALTSAALSFLVDLLQTGDGLQWLYTTDLYVLLDVVLQRVEDEADVEEAAADVDRDVVCLCVRLLLTAVERWDGWQRDGKGYKRSEAAESMEALQAVDVDHRAKGPASRAVMEERKVWAAELLQAMERRERDGLEPSGS